jgi:hypothetical protein
MATAAAVRSELSVGTKPIVDGVNLWPDLSEIDDDSDATNDALNVSWMECAPALTTVLSQIYHLPNLQKG